MVVDHINSIKTDNRISNLQLLTKEENSTKASNDSCYLSGDSHPKAKLTVELSEKLFNEYKTGIFSYRDLAKKYGISHSRVGQIIKEHGYTRIPYRGKTEDKCPDAPRYKAIGNSWAVPVVRWIGNRMKVKVVNTIFHPAMIRHPHIHGHYATGPWEFLNLLQHSRLVVSGSFHATIFSMLYNKPFVAVNGVKDNRMYTMLEKAGFLSRSISLDEVDKWNNTNLLHCDFSQADVYITEQRKASIDYLRHSIEN